MAIFDEVISGINGSVYIYKKLEGGYLKVRVKDGIPHDNIISVGSYIHGSFIVLNNKYVVEIREGKMYLGEEYIHEVPDNIEEYTDILKLDERIPLKALGVEPIETDKGKVLPSICGKHVVWHLNGTPVGYCKLKYLTRHDDGCAFPTKDGEYDEKGWFYPRTFYNNMYRGVFLVKYSHYMLIPLYCEYIVVDTNTKRKVRSINMSKREYDTIHKNPYLLSDMLDYEESEKSHKDTKSAQSIVEEVLKRGYLTLHDIANIDSAQVFECVESLASAFDKGLGHIKYAWSSKGDCGCCNGGNGECSCGGREHTQDEGVSAEKEFAIPVGTVIWKADSNMSRMFYPDRQTRDIRVTAINSKYAVLSTDKGDVGVVPVSGLVGERPIMECSLCTTCISLGYDSYEFNTTLGQAMDMILCDILPKCGYYPLSMNGLGLVEFLAYTGSMGRHLVCDRHAYKNGYPESICKG